MTATFLDALADYVEVLTRSAETTSQAEDRSTYTSHLAAAAAIFASLHSGRLAEAREIVDSERHAYGWGYLSGDEGAAVTAAFDRFASLIETANTPR